MKFFLDLGNAVKELDKKEFLFCISFLVSKECKDFFINYMDSQNGYYLSCSNNDFILNDLVYCLKFYSKVKEVI